MPYTVIGDHSLYGMGKNHLQDDNTESSVTLCGIRELSFAYETVIDDDRKLMMDVSSERILANPGFYCKRCIKALNKRNG